MSYSSEVLADSPLWFAKLDEPSGATMADSSGNARSGSYVGSVTLAQSPLVSDGGTSAAFTTTSTYGEVANAAFMNSLTAVSLEAVVKTTAATGTILGRNSGSTPWRIGVITGGFAFLEIRNTGSATQLTGATVINDGAKHHVVGTWDGTNMRLYVDGVLDGGPTAKPSPLATVSVSMRVAQRAGDSPLVGTIDNPALYGTALSAARVTAHFAAAATNGTLATTFDGATLAASGTHTSSGNTGTLATTLAGATFAASGTETITGTLSATLAGATLAATGVETITGTFTTTLAGVTLSGAGGETFTGTLTTTLAGAALSATGVETITGTSAVTLAGATLAASGSVTIPGVSGTLATTLAGATLAAAGTETITGAFATTLAGAALSAVGVMQPSGTLAVTLQGATLAAAGNSHQPFRDIKVLAITDVSRAITPVDVSRNPAPVESPRPFTITEEVYA